MAASWKEGLTRIVVIQKSSANLIDSSNDELSFLTYFIIWYILYNYWCLIIFSIFQHGILVSRSAMAHLQHEVTQGLPKLHHPFCKPMPWWTIGTNRWWTHQLWCNPLNRVIWTLGCIKTANLWGSITLPVRSKQKKWWFLIHCIKSFFFFRLQEMVETLLAANASVDLSRSDGATALILASQVWGSMGLMGLVDLVGPKVGGWESLGSHLRKSSFSNDFRRDIRSKHIQQWFVNNI